MQKRKFDFNYVAIISCAIVFICSIATIIISYILSYKYPVEDYIDVIISFDVQSGIHTTETLFNLIMGAFIIPSCIGIFIYLWKNIHNKIKKLLILPLITSLIGAGFVIALYSVKLMMIFKIAPDYNTGINEAENLALFTQLVNISDILSLVAYILLYTLGTGIFGVITLRTASVRGNISWLAIASGVLALGKIGYFLQSTAGAVFSLAASMGAILYFFWIASFAFVLYQAIKENKMNYEIEETIVS
ncbi:MAG: hypothetical protein ACTSSH_08400 [Candidatus Heimdallarchaeota archaeon]